MRKYIFCALLTAFLATPFIAKGLNLNFGSSAFSISNSEVTVNYNNPESFTTYKEEFSVDLPCNILEINWVEGKVKIETDAKAEKITISEKTNKPASEDLCMQYRVADNAISLCYAKAGKHNLDGLTKELYIKLPQNTEFQEVHMTSSSADIDAKFNKTKVLKLFNVSGDLDFEINSANSIEASNTSGETDIEARKADTVVINEVSGETELEFAQAPGSIDVQSSSGNVEVKLPLGTTVNTKTNTLSGTVTNDFSQKDMAECKININSVSGSIKIKTR